MTQAVARKDGTEQVDTVHGAEGGDKCAKRPIITATDEGSSDVFCNSIGVVRIDDKVKEHKIGGGPVDGESKSCKPHSPVLTKGSTTVFVNSKGMGRKEDTYKCGAKIITGSENVFAGG